MFCYKGINLSQRQCPVTVETRDSTGNTDSTFRPPGVLTTNLRFISGTLAIKTTYIGSLAQLFDAGKPLSMPGDIPEATTDPRPLVSGKPSP